MFAAAVRAALWQLLVVAVVGVQQRYAANEKMAIQSERAVEMLERTGEKSSDKQKHAGKSGAEHGAEMKLGVMNKHGVTRYNRHRIRKAKHKHGKFFQPDFSNKMRQEFAGATDLTENVSWGWHHPNGVYNTIPVGGPLIDDDENIYLGSDDAIRKFSIIGELLWSYAPRGQLAAAPSLSISSARRMEMSTEKADEEVTAEEEEMLKPEWAKDGGNGSEATYSFQFFKNVKPGDIIKVKPGMGYHADGKEMYKAGDQGLISSILPKGDDGLKERAVIEWTRTGRKSVVQLASLKDRFARVEPSKKTTELPPMLVGSTTSGYVFALNLLDGEELWATQASDMIHGVKGAVGCKDGVVVVATNRCLDRYCYRYRNQTNPLTPGNSVIRGLSASDGSAIWEFKPMSPVWNFVPQWGRDDTVMFQDYEGRVYCLEFTTGQLIYKVGGDIGTHTQAAATYDPAHNIIVALGMKHYSHRYCNPYPAPGILPHCNTWPGGEGFIRGYNATSGRRMWETTTPEPPASGAIGILNSPPGHTRLVVGMGYNCWHNSPSQIWSVDPHNGHSRWQKDGPTLWTGMCAGDKEGGDIRRAMGGRAACVPNSWSLPAIDSTGDVYIGNQVGVLQRIGSPSGRNKDVQLLSTLTTGVAFQDAAIAFAPGIMAVSTCTSLIVFQVSDASTDFSEALPTNASYEYTP